MGAFYLPLSICCLLCTAFHGRCRQCWSNFHIKPPNSRRPSSHWVRSLLQRTFPWLQCETLSNYELQPIRLEWALSLAVWRPEPFRYRPVDEGRIPGPLAPKFSVLTTVLQVVNKFVFDIRLWSSQEWDDMTNLIKCLTQVRCTTKPWRKKWFICQLRDASCPYELN